MIEHIRTGQPETYAAAYAKDGIISIGLGFDDHPQEFPFAIRLSQPAALALAQSLLQAIQDLAKREPIAVTPAKLQARLGKLAVFPVNPSR